MESGRGVNIPHFGALTFEPSNQAAGMNLRPCFIPNQELAALIKDRKTQLDVTVEGSIYQQGIRMSYLNPVPIAAACYLPTDFVKSSIDLIFKAINDLIFRDYSLVLDFSSLLTIRVIERKLSVVFHDDVKRSSSNIAKSWPLKSINNSISANVQFGGQKKGTCQIISPVRALIAHRTTSRLSDLQKPDVSSLHDIKAKIQKLNESSRDLSNIAPHD
jgi:hypothetical protein